MYVDYYTVLSKKTNLINVLTKVYCLVYCIEVSKKKREKQMTTQTRIVKVSTPEANVSDRIVTYDLYVNDVYVSTFSDVCAAMDAKDSYK